MTKPKQDQITRRKSHATYSPVGANADWNFWFWGACHRTSRPPLFSISTDLVGFCGPLQNEDCEFIPLASYFYSLLGKDFGSPRTKEKLVTRRELGRRKFVCRTPIFFLTGRHATFCVERSCLMSLILPLLKSAVSNLWIPSPYLSARKE